MACTKPADSPTKQKVRLPGFQAATQAGGLTAAWSGGGTLSDQTTRLGFQVATCCPPSPQRELASQEAPGGLPGTACWWRRWQRGSPAGRHAGRQAVTHEGGRQGAGASACWAHRGQRAETTIKTHEKVKPATLGRCKQLPSQPAGYRPPALIDCPPGPRSVAAVDAWLARMARGAFPSGTNILDLGFTCAGPHVACMGADAPPG